MLPGPQACSSLTRQHLLLFGDQVLSCSDPAALPSYAHSPRVTVQGSHLARSVPQLPYLLASAKNYSTVQESFRLAAPRYQPFLFFIWLI